MLCVNVDRKSWRKECDIIRQYYFKWCYDKFFIVCVAVSITIARRIGRVGHKGIYFREDTLLIHESTL